MLHRRNSGIKHLNKKSYVKLFIDGMLKVYGGALLEGPYADFEPLMEMLRSRRFSSQLLRGMLDYPTKSLDLLSSSVGFCKKSAILKLPVQLADNKFTIYVGLLFSLLRCADKFDLPIFTDASLQIVGISFSRLFCSSSQSYILSPFNAELENYAQIAALIGLNRSLIVDIKEKKFAVSWHLNMLVMQSLPECAPPVQSMDGKVVEAWFKKQLPKTVAEFLKSGVVKHGNTSTIVKYCFDLWHPTRCRLILTPKLKEK
jgi:hypothetical protein